MMSNQRDEWVLNRPYVQMEGFPGRALAQPLVTRPPAAIIDVNLTAMSSRHMTTPLQGLGFAATITRQLRRDHLHLAYGVFGLLVAALLGAWPGLIDRQAALAWITTSPAIVFLAVALTFTGQGFARRHCQNAHRRLYPQAETLAGVARYRAGGTKLSS